MSFWAGGGVAKTILILMLARKLFESKQQHKVVSWDVPSESGLLISKRADDDTFIDRVQDDDDDLQRAAN